MAKVFQILVPEDTLVSRVISSENQVTELFVIDRADKQFISSHESELKRPALYILINRDTKQLYVGETDDSYKRLKNHESKDFWSEAIVFHSTNETLSTTEVKWLEAKTYEVLNSNGYYDLSHNKQTPQYPNLKKNQIYTLLPIFEEAKNYVCAAGFDFFIKLGDANTPVPKPYQPTTSPNTKVQPYLSSSRCLPSYLSSIKGSFIRGVLNELKMGDSILNLNIDELKTVRNVVRQKEKKANLHSQYSCSISQLIHYIEHNLSFNEFEHDALLVKNMKKNQTEKSI